MREIRFRAWDVRERKMVPGVTPSPNAYSDVWADCGISGEHGEYSAKDLKLMQYTGLKDKNGKEIYEGDILEDNEYIEDGNPRDLVVWNEECGLWETRDWGFSGDEFDGCEVVGNIHESPELLEGGSK